MLCVLDVEERVAVGFGEDVAEGAGVSSGRLPKRCCATYAQKMSLSKWRNSGAPSASRTSWRRTSGRSLVNPNSSAWVVLVELDAAFAGGGAVAVEVVGGALDGAGRVAGAPRAAGDADVLQAVVAHQEVDLGQAGGACRTLRVNGGPGLLVAVAGRLLEDAGEACGVLVAQGVELDADAAVRQQGPSSAAVPAVVPVAAVAGPAVAPGMAATEAPAATPTSRAGASTDGWERGTVCGRGLVRRRVSRPVPRCSP